MPLAGNGVSHATTGIFDVAYSPWNQMDVTVKNRLADMFTVVHTQVEPLHRCIRFQNPRTFSIK